MTTARRNATVLTAGAVLAAVVLHRAGAGTLAAPDRWTVDGWRALAVDHGPAVTALVLVRLAALTACAWLALLGALTTALARSRHRLVRRWLRAVTPRMLRPALGAVGALTLAAPAAHAAEPVSTPPVMVLVTTTTVPATSAVSAAIPSTTNVPITTTPAPPPPTMRRLPDPVVGNPAPAGHTWTVARGEHFWHIAEVTITRHLGRTPRTAEVDAYWRRLVAANRDRLVDRDNADLLFAGQEVVLPPPG
jgi:hypothetical protein